MEEWIEGELRAPGEIIAFFTPGDSFLWNVECGMWRLGFKRMLTGGSSSKAPMKRLKRSSPITSLVSRLKSSGNCIFLRKVIKNMGKNN